MGGKRGVFQLLRAMVDVHHDSVLSAGDADSSEDAMHNAFARLRKLAHPGSVIVIVSDFNRTSDDMTRHIHWLCQHCTCSAIQILDVVELNLPDRGLYPISDGTRRGELDASQRKVREAHTRARVAKTGLLESLFNHGGNQFSQYNAAGSLTDAAAQILSRRSRLLVDGTGGGQ